MMPQEPGATNPEEKEEPVAETNPDLEKILAELSKRLMTTWTIGKGPRQIFKT